MSLSFEVDEDGRPTDHDLASEGKNLAEVGENIFVFALELGPASAERIFHPRCELDTELLVEGAEEAEDLDDLERRLAVEVDGAELVHDEVYERLDAAGILVVEDVLQGSRQRRWGMDDVGDGDRTSKKDDQTESVSLLFWLKMLLACGMNHFQNLSCKSVGQCFDPAVLASVSALSEFSLIGVPVRMPAINSAAARCLFLSLFASSSSNVGRSASKGSSPSSWTVHGVSGGNVRQVLGDLTNGLDRTEVVLHHHFRVVLCRVMDRELLPERRIHCDCSNRRHYLFAARLPSRNRGLLWVRGQKAVYCLAPY